MKEAMISPLEPREYQTGWTEDTPPQPIMGGSGYRVAQVVEQGETFPMAEPIFWAECGDEVEQDEYVYNSADKKFYPVNLPEN